MRSQKVNKPTPKKQVQVFHGNPDSLENQQPVSIPRVKNIRPLPQTAEEYNGMPVRTVISVEVGNMTATDVRTALNEVRKVYDNSYNPTYVVVTRNGTLSNDVLFEQEFLDVVNSVCEIKDGKIVLKDGSKEVRIIRAQY